MKRVICLLGIVSVLVVLASCAQATPAPTPVPTRFPSTATIGGQPFEAGRTRVQANGIGYLGPGCTPENNPDIVLQNVCKTYQIEGSFSGIVEAIEDTGQWHKSDLIRVLLDNGRIAWYHKTQIEIK